MLSTTKNLEGHILLRGFAVRPSVTFSGASFQKDGKHFYDVTFVS